MTNKKKSKKVSNNIAASAGLTGKIREFKDFVEQSRMEMKKVTYPSQKQTIATCGSVLFLVVLIAVFLGLIDMALSEIMKIVLP